MGAAAPDLPARIRPASMTLTTTPTAPTVAVTGATGFVGRGIVAALRRRGIRVRALARSADTALEADAEVIRGTLEDPPSLARLTEGCPVLVHCAGAVRASTADAFHRINADATAALGRLCAENGVRLVLVSSLAAREPGLSPYAASKRAAEEALASTPGLDWCAVRPPLVYGPGDRATLPVFKMMRHGWLAVPAVPGARFSAIYRDDLGEAMAALAENDVRGIFDVSDATPDGYTWNDMAAGGRVSRSARVSHRPFVGMPTITGSKHSDHGTSTMNPMATRPETQPDPVFARMCELLAPFNARGINITRQTHITTDLEIDSVAVLDLIMEIEDEYGISFPMNLISEIRTVGNLVDAIHQLSGAK